MGSPRPKIEMLPAMAFKISSRGARLLLTYVLPRFHTVAPFGDIYLILRPLEREFFVENSLPLI